MSNPITTYEQAIRQAMAQDTAQLPELSESSIVIVQDLVDDGGTIANRISTAINRSRGLGVLIYDRRGTVPQPNHKTLRADVTLRVQVYINPAKYARHSDSASSDDLLSRMLTFLHHHQMGKGQHCNWRSKVTEFYQVADDDHIVWEIQLTQDLTF